MFLSQENCRDIDKYYKNCFVKFPEMFGDKLFFVTRVTEREIQGNHIEESDGEEAPFVFHLFSKDYDEEKAHRSINAEFLLPRKSYFVMDKHAYLLYRIPNRQYKKGICNDNTQIMRLTASGEFSNAGVTWQHVKAYVEKPSFPQFDLKNELSSYALSPRVAVCKSGGVFVDRIRIGSFDPKLKTLTLKNNMFMTEMETIVKNTGQDIKIVVGK